MIRLLLCLLIALPAVAQDSVPSWYGTDSAPTFLSSVFTVECGATNKVATGDGLSVTNWTMLVQSNVANAQLWVNVNFYSNSGVLIDSGVRVSATIGAVTTNLSMIYATNPAVGNQVCLGAWYAPIGNLASNVITITVSNNNTWQGLVGNSAVIHNCNQTNAPTQFSTNYATLDGFLTNSLPARTNDHATRFVWTMNWDELSNPSWSFNGNSPERVVWGTNGTIQMASLDYSNHVTSAEAVFTEQDAVPGNLTWSFMARADYLTNSPTASSGPPSANLVQQLDASIITGSDGDPISTWTATVGKNATSSGGNRPTLQTAEKNGLNVVRFDGTDDFISTVDFDSPPSQPFVVFLVYKQASISTHQFIVDTAHTDSERFVFYSDNANNLQAYSGSFVVIGAANTSWHIVSLEMNGASSKYRFDGGTETTFTGSPGSNGIDSLYLGLANDGSNPFPGDIAEILVYSGSIADKAAYFSYLNNKWAVY